MTLTTERLREIAEDGFLEHGDAKLMARELLDNREAQPVAVTDEMALAFHRALNDGGIGESDLEEIKVGLRGALCNITAPPAPAVPGGLKRAVTFYEQVKRENPPVETGAWKDAVNWVLEEACRAAMLAQPVSGGYKLPPHLYRELVNSLRDTAVKFSGTEQLRERLNTALSQFIEPDHPHTRTVAPEGGNDHDTRR